MLQGYLEQPHMDMPSLETFSYYMLNKKNKKVKAGNFCSGSRKEAHNLTGCQQGGCSAGCGWQWPHLPRELSGKVQRKSRSSWYLPLFVRGEKNSNVTFGTLFEGISIENKRKQQLGTTYLSWAQLCPCNWQPMEAEQLCNTASHVHVTQ